MEGARAGTAKHALAVSVTCGFYFGYNTGVVSGLTQTVVDCHFFPGKAATTQAALSGVFTACILVGGIVGAVAGVSVADRFGRRRGLAVCGMLGLSTIFLGVVDNFWLMVAIRTVMGVTVGAVSVICPLYVTEVCDPQVRGSVGTVFQLAICFSILVGQVFNLAFTPNYDPDVASERCANGWRLQLSMGVVPAVAILVHVLLLKLPESEEWIAQNNRVDAGLDEREGGSEPLQSPPSEDGEDHVVVVVKEYSWYDLLGTRVGREWASIGVGLACSAQLTGINAFIFYSPQIFHDAGLHDVLVLTTAAAATDDRSPDRDDLERAPFVLFVCGAQRRSGLGDHGPRVAGLHLLFRDRARRALLLDGL
ncbi:Plastidic glucose transporter 4 (AtpGlcT) [Durusdinium trenchii]|uniref:Hexose transporter 1 n=1 Tax=Durusdinium trenchii TaxID=1381693 RepID=A0ABP0LFC5_9DINO